MELEELRIDVSSEEVEWEETARWIKFEEDVEEGSGRWGRPHVSALTFHSLIQLRRGLEKGGCGLKEDFLPKIYLYSEENNLVDWQGFTDSMCIWASIFFPELSS